MPCTYGFVGAGSLDQSCIGSPSESAFSRYIIPIIGGACDCASAWLEAQSRIAATRADRELTGGRKYGAPIILSILRPWEKSFLRIAGSSSRIGSMPDKAGILEGGALDCLCSSMDEAKGGVFIMGGIHHYYE